MRHSVASRSTFGRVALRVERVKTKKTADFGSKTAVLYQDLYYSKKLVKILVKNFFNMFSYLSRIEDPPPKRTAARSNRAGNAISGGCAMRRNKKRAHARCALFPLLPFACRPLLLPRRDNETCSAPLRSVYPALRLGRIASGTPLRPRKTSSAALFFNL